MSERSVEASRAVIQGFVTGALGCGCPAEVFRQIESSWPRVERTDPNYLRILIGGRLLIYAVEGSEGSSLLHWLPSLVERGRAERDAAAYNRFRLVLLMDGAADGRDEMEAAFARQAGDDGKAHLHFLPSGSAWHAVRSALESDFTTG
ncbi:hypothetical protein [Methyloterricola oryzae]|uniref:hypothetical protein n=1 Tax=Methyloterricola oryzae TaxID=1495050 RepID=UPI00069A1538|nr:hypothetical protein [Methyloterricola oryzae]